MKLCMIAGLLALACMTQAREELGDATFEKLRDYIRPRPDELKWKEIPWLTTFADGVKSADAADKPLLLWAMNGHPLACT